MVVLPKCCIIANKFNKKQQKMANLKNYSIGIEPEAHEALIQIKDKTGAPIQWQIREAIDAYIIAMGRKEGGQDGR